MKNSPHIVEVTDDNFEHTVIAASHIAPVLVDFWAEWCQPCKQMLPTLLKLVDEFAGDFVLAKLNIDEQSNLAAEAGVRSVPTVMVFRKGMVVDQFLGIQPETVIREIIERNRFSEADRLMSQAAEKAALGLWPAATALAHQAAVLEPGNGVLQFEVASFLVGAGDLDGAETTLAGLPREVRESPEADTLRARIDLSRALIGAPDRSALEETVEHQPLEPLPRYQLAARYLEEGEAESALQQLLAIVQMDRGFREDGARKAMLAVFAQLDPDDPLIARYRTQMLNILH